MKTTMMFFAFTGVVLHSSAMAQENQDRNEGGVDLIPVAVSGDPQAVAGDTRLQAGSRMIEEIIVTAQKREENLKDVPLSVAAFSASQLDAKGVLDSADLPRITPGLTVTTQIGFTSTFIRGVGSDAFILGDPAVTTYVDGVYIPFALGSVEDFGTIDRIEVLKGPQGTLFGRNTLGGAIKIETKAPSLGRPEFSLQSIYTGDPAGSKSRVSISIPLWEDALAVSVAGLYNSGRSHLDGTQGPGRDPLLRDVSKGYRVQALFKPADWVDLRLSYSYSKQDGPETFAVNTDPSLAGFAVGIRSQDPRKGANDEPNFFHSGNEISYAKLHIDAGWFDFNVLGSHQDVRNVQSYDFDGSSQALVSFNSKPGFADVTTGDFQVSSNRDFPLADWLQVQFGVYYFKEQGGFDPAYLSVAGVDLPGGRIAGLKVPPALTQAIANVLGQLPVPVGITLDYVGILDTRSIAYYTQDTINVTDWFAVTIGARYQSEERVINRSSSGIRNMDGSTTIIPIQNFSGIDDPRYRSTTDSFDPKVSFNFRPGWSWLGDAPLLYANYQTATTSKTFNVINIYSPPQKINGTKIKAYEAGFKTRLVDRLVDINVAAFHYDIDQPQVQIVSLLAGGAVRLENAGGQRIQGFDFDSSVQLFPDLTNNGLVLTLSGAYLDAAYTSYVNGSGYDQVTGLFSENNNYTGNRIVRTPKTSGTAALSQTFFLESGELEAAVDYYWTDKFYYLAQNTPSVEEEAYGLLGAHASYLYSPWNVRVTVFGMNILNEKYNLARFRTDFGSNDLVAPLSVYGVRFNYDF